MTNGLSVTLLSYSDVLCYLIRLYFLNMPQLNQVIVVDKSLAWVQGRNRWLLQAVRILFRLPHSVIFDYYSHHGLFNFTCFMTRSRKAWLLINFPKNVHLYPFHFMKNECISQCDVAHVLLLSEPFHLVKLSVGWNLFPESEIENWPKYCTVQHKDCSITLIIAHHGTPQTPLTSWKWTH